MASESFFDNTAFFHTIYSMLYFNPDPGNSLVLLFVSRSKLFFLGFFLLGHAHFNTIRSVPDKTGILPKPCTLGEGKRFFITYLLVMNTPFVCGTQSYFHIRRNVPFLSGV